MKQSALTKLVTILAGVWIATSSANATLTFTGGLADLTFYYDSPNDRWDVVFRNKGTTEATGNTNLYSGFTGIVGHDTTNDVTFNNLQINVSSAPLATVNSIGYFITPANGTGYQNNSNPDNGPIVNQPDLGIRTRLRENQVAIGNGLDTQANQFANMRLSLDWVNSTRPAGADFIMFKEDVILYETATGNFSHDWASYDHTHWHFGFSEGGDYSLVFNIEGIDGTYGASAATSQITLNFSVVPEPSSALLGMFTLAALGLRRKR